MTDAEKARIWEMLERFANEEPPQKTKPMKLTEADIGHAANLSMLMCDKLSDLIEEADEDPGEVMHACWITLTHWLLARGWTPGELVNEVVVHGAIETSEGNA
jgi:hypothetical protein